MGFTLTVKLTKGANFLDDMDNTKLTEKLDLPTRNDSVTQKKAKKARDDSDDKETTKD